ncbi:hypothetical protein F8M41_020786 [Gigaspora margarita]|uniref:Uncharacterized protein n=1 Tax=Gigaspora margarita TaxID=4874 RepID=A0A8H4EJH0_GIGMA|nr:hypothetical protein F8M41_020786 [Gigaspora margarita]
MIDTQPSHPDLQESLFHWELDSLSKIWNNFPPFHWLIYAFLVIQSIPSMILALTVLLSCMIISAIGSLCIVITSIILWVPPLLIVICINLFNEMLLGVGNLVRTLEMYGTDLGFLGTMNNI